MPTKKPKQEKEASKLSDGERTTGPAHSRGRRKGYRKLSMKPREGEPIAVFFPVQAFTPIREMNRAYAEWTIKMLNGDKTEAAERLGISLRTIYNWFPEPE